MAIKGLSRLIVADYTEASGTVTYSNAVVTQKMAEYSAEVNSSDTESLYLDNAVSETDGGEFTDGTLSITVGDLDNETSKRFYKLKEKKLKIGEEDVTQYVYDDETKSNELGVGVIELHQTDGTEFYRAVFFPRVKFNISANSAKTKGEKVEWQTPQISGSILRSAQSSDDGVHPWKIEADCATEATAIEYLLQCGGKTASA